MSREPGIPAGEDATLDERTALASLIESFRAAEAHISSLVGMCRAAAYEVQVNYGLQKDNPLVVCLKQAATEATGG